MQINIKLNGSHRRSMANDVWIQKHLKLVETSPLVDGERNRSCNSSLDNKEMKRTGGVVQRLSHPFYPVTLMTTPFTSYYDGDSDHCHTHSEMNNPDMNNPCHSHPGCYQSRIWLNQYPVAKNVSVRTSRMKNHDSQNPHIPKHPSLYRN